VKEGKRDIHILCDATLKFKVKSDAAKVGKSISEFCVEALQTGKIVSRLSSEQMSLLRNLAHLRKVATEISGALKKDQVDKITLTIAEDVILKIDSLLNQFYK
jgi:hypothetical protein